MPRQSPDQPILLVVAGPNGSGKSSVYANADLEWSGRSVWIVNPDLLAARISEVEHMPLIDANLAAVQRVEAWIEASIVVHKTIGVENSAIDRQVSAPRGQGQGTWVRHLAHLRSPG